MKTTIPPIFKATLTAAAVAIIMAAPATVAAPANMPAAAPAEWVNGDSFLDPGTTIQSVAAHQELMIRVN
jgi:hypothetical protein